MGVSKFQAVCGGEKTLADVPDEDYFEACKLTDLMGVKAIAKLDSRTPFAITPAKGAKHPLARQGTMSPAGLIKHVFVHGPLRPDDESGAALSKGLLEGVEVRKGSIAPAMMFEEDSKRPSVVLLDKADVAKSKMAAPPRVVGYTYSCDSPTAFAQKLKAIDDLEGYKASGGGACQRDIATVTLANGDTVEAYVYHRPKASRAKRVWGGDWMRRKEKGVGSEAARVEEEEAAAKRAGETRAGVCALLANNLEDKKGGKVDPQAALPGKVVGLYFAAKGNPGSAAFTPKLAKLYNDVNGGKSPGDKPFEVVYVSSDGSADEQQQFMDASHADWLRCGYSSGVREKLKSRFGIFDGAEAGDFPNVTRRCGLPCLLLLGPHFEELGLYDCDEGGNGLKLIAAGGAQTPRGSNAKSGSGVVDGWMPLAWPATLPTAGGAVSATPVTPLPTGLESEVLTLHKVESEWGGLEDDVAAYNAALLARLGSKRGPEVEFARLRRGCARLGAWLAANDATLTGTALPGLTDDGKAGGKAGGGAGGAGGDGNKDEHGCFCDPECETIGLLHDARRCEHDAAIRAKEAAQLAVLVERLKTEPEYASRAMELFAAVGQPTTGAEAQMAARVKALEEHQKWLQARRAERLAHENDVAAFEATVDRAIELTAFPVPTVDTSEQLTELLRAGNVQARGLEKPPPQGATAASKAEAEDLLISWREIQPAISLRTSECEGNSRDAVEQARLLAECAALGRAYRAWEGRTRRLLTPDPSRKAADAETLRAQAEAASAQLPEGESHLERAKRLRAQLRKFDDESTSGAKGATLSSHANLPSEKEMELSIAHVRELADKLALAAAAAPKQRYDRKSVSAAMGALGGASDPRLDRFKSTGVGSGIIGEDFDPFPLDSAPEDMGDDSSTMVAGDATDAMEFSLTVIQHVNKVRTQPQAYAAGLRARLKGCYEGNVFYAPWSKAGRPVTTKEGQKAVDDLINRLERTPPLPPLEHLPALQTASSKLGDELASGRERSKTSAIEDRLKTVGTWSGVAGEAVMYGMRLPEAIVTTMLLCDGDSQRKNRAFVLNPDVKFACFSSTELPRGARVAGGLGPIGVLSLLSHFFPSLKEEITVEFQGPVEKRRRPMPEDMAKVLRAIPSDEACDVALSALAKGKHLRLEYKITSVNIIVTDSRGAKQVSRLKWK